MKYQNVFWGFTDGHLLEKVAAQLAKIVVIFEKVVEKV